MLWLALHLPWLPLEAVASGAHALPRCVMHERVVLLADAAAQAAGIVPGMSLASALGLLPALLPLARNPAHERQLMQVLALASSQYTPQVVVEPQMLKLEVQASLRLFGGLPALLRSLRRCVDALGLDPRLGLAPTATAAALLARCAATGATTSGAARATTLAQAERRLDVLPLGQAAPVLFELLHGIGCRTLGDVRALPRQGLQRRGGGALLSLLDRAYGDAPDPQTWFEPPREFAQTLELMERSDDAAMLGFAAMRLVQALAGWLACQWLATSAFSLWLQHETRGRRALPPTRLRIELGQPSRDAAQLGLLLRERLSRCALPAPVYALELRLDEAVALAGHAAALPFGSDRSGARWHDAGRDAENLLALLDRLSARLGAQHVQRWAPHADHRPEKAARSLSANDAPASARASGGPAQAVDAPPLPRPAWLLPEPLRLAEHEGRPVHGGPLVLCSRPERIEAGWFDGAPACRDYHVAVGRDHRLRWVFCERRGALSTPSGWFLHGLFA